MEENKKRRKKLMWQGIFLGLLIVGTIYISWQQTGNDTDTNTTNGFRKDEGMVFGTAYHVTYQSDQSLKREIEEALEEVDNEFSMFNENSTVSAINRGEDPERSKMFNEVLHLANIVKEDTYGAFDITVAPLVNAWGFGFKHQQTPTAEQVDSLLKIRSQMDFSAIAKGYATDVVAHLLLSKGIKNFMVEIGGEVVVEGLSPSNEYWRIGVAKPVEDSLAVNKELHTILQMNNAALATSGNYHNYYYKGGRKYAHTIDPRTGYPVQHSILSATVIGRTCAMADAYATAFMVLGLEKTKDVLSRHTDLMAYLIYTDEKGNLTVWNSTEIDGMIVGDECGVRSEE